MGALEFSPPPPRIQSSHSNGRGESSCSCCTQPKLIPTGNSLNIHIVYSYSCFSLSILVLIYSRFKHLMYNLQVIFSYSFKLSRNNNTRIACFPSQRTTFLMRRCCGLQTNLKPDFHKKKKRKCATKKLHLPEQLNICTLTIIGAKKRINHAAKHKLTLAVKQSHSGIKHPSALNFCKKENTVIV